MTNKQPVPQTTPGIDPPIAFNVSHDNGLIAMAFGKGAHGPPSFSLGVDVMKVRIPGRDSLASFIDTMEDQACTYLSVMVRMHSPVFSSLRT